ncbi:hypothetical protein Dimus_035335 [Dionaea muscipula]
MGFKNVDATRFFIRSSHCSRFSRIDVASTQRTDATVDASLNANEDVDMEAPHDGKEHECEVVIGGKYRSEFWNHFLQIKLNGVVVKAKCKYCSKVLKAESKNGTTALKDHYLLVPRGAREVRGGGVNELLGFSKLF